MQLVTHSGKFHADDVFATAVLFARFGKDTCTVTRSRDPDVLAAGDIVYDVGMVYDPVIARFDHHQAGGAVTRENGIPYAAFGLIWKHYGRELCSSDAVWQTLDEQLVCRVDATDTGYASPASYTVPTLEHYTLDKLANAFNTTWSESYDEQFEHFTELVDFAMRVIEREIKRAEASVAGRATVEDVYQSAVDKRIIELDCGYPWREVLVAHPEPCFVIFPEIDTTRFMVQAVHQTLTGYETRVPFPKAWGGLTDVALSEVTGIPGSRFCHSAGFLAVHDTREGARALALKALQLAGR
ncbi:MAG: hypothetical protein RL150_477 [Candidatus Parcubacteria bacterium]|jgi:uncharacterized UPF0160 family protein